MATANEMKREINTLNFLKAVYIHQEKERKLLEEIIAKRLTSVIQKNIFPNLKVVFCTLNEPQCPSTKPDKLKKRT